MLHRLIVQPPIAAADDRLWEESLPRYFIDVRNAEGERSLDAEGVELTTDGDAEAYASGFATTLPIDGAVPDRVIVRNEAGATVCVVSTEQNAPTQPTLGDIL